VKPKIKIKNWIITDEYGYYHLIGDVIYHPNLGSTRASTSKLLKIDFEKMTAETLNSIYLLEK